MILTGGSGYEKYYGKNILSWNGAYKKSLTKYGQSSIMKLFIHALGVPMKKNHEIPTLPKERKKGYDKRKRN